MSRGPGRVQSAILFAFEAEPNRKFSVMDLAEIAFPYVPITSSHTGAISRALKSPALRAKLDLRACRSGALHSGGWRHIFGRAS